MGTSKQATPKTDDKPATETRIRHVRVPDSIWIPAAQRAEADGIRISEAVRALLRGYERGDFVI